MPKLIRMSFLALCLGASSLVVRAQAPVSPLPPVPPLTPIPPVFSLAPFGSSDDVMALASSELGARSVLKGAPYAATAINETRQVLSDGNRIERSSTFTLYRDTQGRTRQELAGGIVVIDDVVAGKRYMLNTQRRSGREIRLAPMPIPPIPPVPPVGATAIPAPPSQPANMSAEEARSWADEMRRWAREFGERMRGEHNVILTRSSSTGDQPQMIERVEVIRLHDRNADAHSPQPPMAPMLPMTLSHPPGPGTKTMLGNRDFDGVQAQGTKTMWTIEAGRVGNKLPIEITSERWHSPDLNVVVLSRYTDPRSGERTFRLEKISRDEPNADLFKVPVDYELKSIPTTRIERK